MNPKIKSLLLPFHFGSIDEKDRIFIERELLTDVETLVDYLDLKRKLESAELIPSEPSPSLWFKLHEKVQSKKKYIIPFSFGAVVAAGILVAVIYFHGLGKDTNSIHPSGDEILFDIRTELPAHSNVI